MSNHTSILIVSSHSAVDQLYVDSIIYSITVARKMKCLVCFDRLTWEISWCQSTLSATSESMAKMWVRRLVLDVEACLCGCVVNRLYRLVYLVIIYT